MSYQNIERIYKTIASIYVRYTEDILPYLRAVTFECVRALASEFYKNPSLGPLELCFGCDNPEVIRMGLIACRIISPAKTAIAIQQGFQIDSNETTGGSSAGSKTGGFEGKMLFDRMQSALLHLQNEKTASQISQIHHQLIFYSLFDLRAHDRPLSIQKSMTDIWNTVPPKTRRGLVAARAHALDLDGAGGWKVQPFSWLPSDTQSHAAVINQLWNSNTLGTIGAIGDKARSEELERKAAQEERDRSPRKRHRGGDARGGGGRGRGGRGRGGGAEANPVQLTHLSCIQTRRAKAAAAETAGAQGAMEAQEGSWG